MTVIVCPPFFRLYILCEKKLFCVFRGVVSLGILFLGHAA